MTKERHQSGWHKIKLFLFTFCITIVLMSVAVITMVKINYSTKLHFNTIINHTDMSNLTAEQVYAAFYTDINNYSLEVVDKNNNMIYITKDDVDISISKEKIDEMVSEIIANQKLFHFFERKNFEIDDIVVIDEVKLQYYIDTSDLFSPKIIIQPKDAYLEFDEYANKFVISPSALGNRLPYDIMEIVENKLVHLELSMNLLELDLYDKPKIKEDNEILVHNLNLYNSYLSKDYIIDMDGALETLEIKKYYDWFIPNFLENSEKINPEDPFSIDIDKLGNYIDYLYKKYNSFGSVREFTTTAGRNIQITQGNYGWWVNYKELKTLIQDALMSNDNNNPVQAPYYQKAAERGSKDYGNSYVEIDLTNQQLWLYIEGKYILTSGVVTGKPSSGNATPPGIYALTYKKRNATLTGPGYSTPVSYWMPFNKDIGLHDANWQTSFGGKRYLTHGSHGCVNLPVNIAETIFSHVEKEFPIILY